MIKKIAIIRKLDNGKYRLYSKKKGPNGKRKNLGTYDSLSGAQQREKEVQYFKNNADDGIINDKETKALSKMSDIASFLEQAGMIDASNKIYKAMNAIDNSLEDNLIDPFANHIDEQMNVGGPVGTSGNIGGGSPSVLSMPQAQALLNIANKLDKRGAFKIANELEEIIKDVLAQQEKQNKSQTKPYCLNPEKNKKEDNTNETIIYMNSFANLKNIANKLDKLSMYEEADAIDSMIFDAIKKLENINFKRKMYKTRDPDKQKEEALTRSNGLDGINVIDNQSAGAFQGLSDAYFYSSYGNLEGVYGGN